MRLAGGCTCRAGDLRGGLQQSGDCARRPYPAADWWCSDRRITQDQHVVRDEALRTADQAVARLVAARPGAGYWPCGTLREAPWRSLSSREKWAPRRRLSGAWFRTRAG